MITRDALIECLPASAYDRSAPLVRKEAASVASVLDGAINSADTLQLEQQPDTTNAGLVDWERNHNLPDACIGGLSAAVPDRLINLMDRIGGRGDLSRPFFIEQAAGLGFPGCTITELGPMTCEDPCDGAPNGDDFIFVWRLNIPFATTVVPMTCESPCDAPLASWGDTHLQCMVTRRKPAHTTALFAYAP